MATSPPSSFRERPPLQSGFRRSFTAPPRSLSFHEKAGLDPSDAAAEILYLHPSTRTVKFSPPFSAIPSASSSIPSQDLDYPVDTVETLPWATPTETTVASGVLRIEKVQGSTNFVKSGNVNQAIMRNSQCWCVDGESKFVLRIAKFQYYRIELPSKTEEDKAKVEELKLLLKKILRFELTPCPFKRGFHVELPESAITPRRKGTWKRRQSTLNSSPLGGTSSPTSRPRGSRAQVSQPSTPSTRKGEESEQIESGSEFDEHDTQSDSTGAEDEPGSHSVDATTPEPAHDSSDDEEDSSVDRDSEEEGSDTSKPSPTLDQAKAPSSSVHPSPLDTDTDPSKETQVQQSEAKSAEPHPSSAKALISDGAPVVPEEQARLAEVNTAQEGVSAPTVEVDKTEESGEEENGEEESGEEDEDESGEEAPTLQRFDVEESDVQEVDVQQAGAQDLAVQEVDVQQADAQDPTVQDISLQESVVEELSVQEPHIPDTSFQEYDKQHSDLEDLQLEPELERQSTETMSIASSVASFHSLASMDSPTSPAYPSPPASDDGGLPSPTPHAERIDPLAMHAQSLHKREISELTIRPSSPRLGGRPNYEPSFSDRPSTSASDFPSTPLLMRSSASDTSWPEIETPGSYPTNQLRRRLKLRRSLSPLPPSSTVFVPPPQQNQSGHLAAAILQKACSLALGKPIEVAVMLIHILARIAGGATVNDLINGELFKKPRQEREQQRNPSLPEQIEVSQDEDLDEDDFGVPIRGRTKSAETARDDDVDSLLDLD